MTEKVTFNKTVRILGTSQPAPIESEGITKEDIRKMEKAIIDNAGIETLNVVKQTALDKRADNIEKATAPLISSTAQLAHKTNEIKAAISRREWDKIQKSASKVKDQMSYESYLHEREMLILAKAIMDKQAKEEGLE